MSITDKFQASIEEWESGKLGRDENHVKAAPAELDIKLDDAMDMQMISIRLQKKLIEDLKLVAKHYGMSYQPLIRQLLTRFVTSEFKNMMNDAIAEAKLRSAQKTLVKGPKPETKTKRAA